MSTVPRTIREQVTERIRDDVIAGSFEAGQALREGELADRFGVSRGPVRDAFLQLSQEGFLSYQANRGVTVKQPPAADHRDFIVSLRRQIECYVIQRGFKSLSSEGLSSIESTLEELRSACASDDVAVVARCDVAFHEAVLVACGGDEFLPVWRLLCSQMLLSYSRLANYQQVYEEHVAIFAALQQRTLTRFIAAIETNIR